MAWDATKPNINNIVDADLTSITNNWAAISTVVGATRLTAGTYITDDAADVVYDNATSKLVAATVQAAIDEIIFPAGMVQYFAGNTPPSSWLEANGDAISRATYAKLFAVIGTIYGVGDGTTTFNLPDLRGTFIRGWDNGKGVDTARVFASSQNDAMEQHSHYTGLQIRPTANTLIGYGTAGFTTNMFTPSSSGNQKTVPAEVDTTATQKSTVTSGVISTGGTVSYPQTTLPGGTGVRTATLSCKAVATETRPINTALLVCIKY